MLNTNRIRRIVLRIPVVTGKTKWAFIEVEASSGTVGTGETTLTQQEAALAAQHDIGPALLGKPADPELLIPSLDPHNLPCAAIISALDQALGDLRAQHAEVGLCAMIGLRRDRVGLYANINRHTWNRSPEGFAESTQIALDAGFDALKVSPFDEVTPGAASLESAVPGLARITSTFVACRPTPDDAPVTMTVGA